MRCIYGSPSRGRRVPINQKSLQLRAGTIIREETIFHQPLSPDYEQSVCNFLSWNIYSYSRGHRLLYAAIGEGRLIVEVQLLEDDIYDWEPRPNGDLYVFQII